MVRCALIGCMLVVANGAPQCCKPGASCWPSSETIAAFGASLSSGNRSYEFADPQWAAQMKWFEQMPIFRDMNSTFEPDELAMAGCFTAQTAEASATDDFCRAAMRNFPRIGIDPGVVVWPLTREDVQKSVRFARQHNLCVCVASTGHEFQSRHTSEGCFMIRTGLFKNIDWDLNKSNALVPGHSSGVVKLGAGLKFFEVHEAAAVANRTVVSGHAGSVGVVGWAIAGGHSMLSPSLGLGVDNLVEVELVAADGSVVIANRQGSTILGEDGRKNQTVDSGELLWALAGGGGSTWGVITSVTYKVFEVTGFMPLSVTYSGSLQRGEQPQPVLQGFLDWSAQNGPKWGGFALASFYSPGVCTDSDQLLPRMLRHIGKCPLAVRLLGGDECSPESVSRSFLGRLLKLNATDAGALVYACPMTCNRCGTWIVNLEMVYTGVADTDFHLGWDGLQQAINNRVPGTPYPAEPDGFRYVSFPQEFAPHWIDKVKQQGAEGINPGPADDAFFKFMIFGSAIVSNENAIDGKFGRAMDEIFGQCSASSDSICPQLQLYKDLPDQDVVAAFPPNATSISQGFRHGLIHAILGIGIGSAQFGGAIYAEKAAQMTTALYAASPNSYMSESGTQFDGDAWKERYWGDSYAKLLGVKRQWDPELLFSCYHCVGDGEEPRCPDNATLPPRSDCILQGEFVYQNVAAVTDSKRSLPNGDKYDALSEVSV